MTSTPPSARRNPVTRTHHGHDFVDPYEWLREKQSPEVIAHLEAENAYTAERTGHLDATTEAIYSEITSRTQQTDLSGPVRTGAYWYYTRTVEGKSYGVYCRVPVAGDDDWTPPVIDGDGSATGATGTGTGKGTGTVPGEQVLFDANAAAEGHDFFSMGGFDVSADGTKLAWSVDVTGDERYTLRVTDLETGIVSDTDVVENTAGGALFSLDGSHLFYTTVDDAWRPDTVWRHRVGTPATDDVTVFTEPDERYWVGIGRTRSRRYLVIGLGSKITSEALLLDAADPTGEFSVVWPRVEGVEYEVEHAVVAGDDRLLILHNDQAENFALVDVAASDPRGERSVVLAHSPDVRLEGVDAFATHLVVSYRRDALTRVGIVPLRADLSTGRIAGPTALGAIEGYGALDELAFDEPLFDVGMTSNPEWNQPTVRIAFTSFVTPSSVLDYDVVSGAMHLLKRQPVLGGYDPDDYAQAREWATASDGTLVPVSLVWKKDVVSPGQPAPTLLYGYGSYEISIDPTFSIPRLSLLDRGMVFAIAHVRGGGELGRAWYENGKTLTKRNTFTDFIAVAQHLIDAGHTTPQQLVAEGRSAGGLLVGAVANIAPELFAGILAGVPFVDALTSILDPSLPLTVIEWDEWGNPLHDAEVYEYMRSYTPYENVRVDAAYPAILAVTSLNDTRVLYVEPAKWVAALRHVGSNALLKTEMSAGHGGVSGRYESWRERAFEYAWVLDTAGVRAAVDAAAAGTAGIAGATGEASSSPT
ncbi:S9 family peptidase [Marisediminicola senii]|uniref:S9 family peptidase n=1 Tax=Marisediminicola senii TaxID=2711233 RepID=UPI0013E9BD27|nr:S9 family peptidase [Marisediminicola senii]